MHGGRGFRGWMAATTVAITLSLVFLVVDKYLRLPQSDAGRNDVALTKPRGTVDAARPALTERISLPEFARPPSTKPQPGILLTLDPGLAGVEEFPRTDQVALVRAPRESHAESAAGFTTGLLRRPPEPATSVVLQAPIASDEFGKNELVALPLQSGTSGIGYLMDAMDAALDRPLHTVSANRPMREVPSYPLQAATLPAVPSPASMKNRIPSPNALLAELALLEQTALANRYSSSPRMVNTGPIPSLTALETNSISQWTTRVQTALGMLVENHGLEHPNSIQDLRELTTLAAEAQTLGNSLADYRVAAQVNRTGYALQRRIAVWQAIQACLDGTSIALNQRTDISAARRELLSAVDAVEHRIGVTGDGSGWLEFLKIDDLRTWLSAGQTQWTAGNELCQKVLARMHSPRLTTAQKNFLAQAEFDAMASQLSAWGTGPIDYRELLTEIEELESDPISRVSSSLAGAVNALYSSNENAERLVSATINTHYRNANVRMSVSADLLRRFLPNGEYEIRPVRQRILGAETQGDSAIQTQLALQLIPDETAWHVDLGVSGDIYSNTRSSKGPAVFHNSSTAQVNSHRYLRVERGGYSVSAQPTNVQSQDYLRKMSTDFDSLPVVGDFVRLLVREQFDQKRGLAQRITRRIIAQQTDGELDRRIEESLTAAERGLQQRLIGPLDRLSLNPMVVSMNTTEDRLSIRYRVANETQLAAHTARPRAPTDSLLSLQMHESAINNAIAQIGLSGKTWTLPELYDRLGQVFQQKNWTLPSDIPEGITIRFAETRPATVELLDGKLRLTLRIAELSQSDGLHIERFLVTSSYIPVADGLAAELIRDGVVEINAAHNRDRFKLRLIFAKVFVSRPEIPLISEDWLQDERSDGLAVSQLTIEEGWLAVAISASESELAAEVAARARAVKLQ